MAMYLLLTSAGLLLFAIALVFAVWLVRHGQFDDLDTPSLRMLHDPDEKAPADSKRATGHRKHA